LISAIDFSSEGRPARGRPALVFDSFTKDHAASRLIHQIDCFY